LLLVKKKDPLKIDGLGGDSADYDCEYFIFILHQILTIIERKNKEIHTKKAASTFLTNPSVSFIYALSVVEFCPNFISLFAASEM
jgi:hypothetical protein